MFICHFGITTIIKVICMIVQSIDHNRSFKTCETKLHAWHVTWLCSLTQEPSTEILKFAAASSRDDVEDGRLLGCCPVLTALSTADPKKSDKKLHFIRIFTLFWSPKKNKNRNLFSFQCCLNWCVDVLFQHFTVLKWCSFETSNQGDGSSKSLQGEQFLLWCSYDCGREPSPSQLSLAETQWLSSGYGHLQWLEQYFGWLHKRSSCRSPLGRILASLQSNLSRVWTFPPCGSLQLQALHTSILAWRRGGYLQKGRCLSDVLSITFGVRYFKTPHADVAELRKSWRIRIST